MLNLLLVLAFAATGFAGDFPPHDALRILIVSDEVNPHGLSPAELTGPGDLSAALSNPLNGLNLAITPDSILEIATDDLADATAALSVASGDPLAYDVLLYFAHRIPNGAGAAVDQANFVAAVEAFLEEGGGVVSFHHGLYLGSGKAGILDIIGGTATGSVPWDTVDGQNVINVAPGHFVTTSEVEYAQSVNYSDVPLGVPLASYEFFNNTPDERYPNVTINASAEQIQLLFASDYVQGGANHILGFTHQRATWQGRVVAYQPGEYQPNALDDLDGNNFQILGNALLFAADAIIVPAFVDFCSGDGGDQMGCTNCPCTNNAPAGTIGGCLNSANTSTRLLASGDTSVTLPAGIGTDLRFDLTGAPPAAFCILNSGDVVGPNNMVNPCFGLSSGTQAISLDGLRCAVLNTRRHGGRSADANGDVGATNNPWGGSGGPPVGLAQAGGGFAAGQTRFFQAINRDDPLLSCMRGLNTSQAVRVVFTP